MGKYIAFIKNWRNQMTSFRWIIGHAKPYMPKLMLVILLDSAAAGVSVVLALIMRNIVDVASGGALPTGSIVTYVAIVLLSLLLRAIVGILGAVVRERFAFGIRSGVYRAVLNSLYRDVSSYHSADVVTRLTSDIDVVARGITEVLPSIISLLVTFVVAFFVLASMDVSFALFGLVLGPVTALVSIVMARKMKKIQAKVQQSESMYKASLQENVENLLVVKAFEAQESANERLSQLREERLYWIKKRQYVSSASGALMGGAFQLGYVGAVAWGALMLTGDVITTGSMLAFVSLVSQIQSPVVGLSRLVPQLVSIFTSSERTIELEKLPPEDMSVPKLQSGPLKLSIDELSFGYAQEMVLKNVALSIRAGEFVALMGDSGIGKTTLIRLVMAYYSPNEGGICLKDGDGNSASVNAGARRYMAYVPQGNTLMSGSIADNLRVGSAQASEEEMWAMLRVVAAEEFVRQLPSGLHTRIGERGYGLSEGQAQRISIARALIKRAPLLILDEATSALDERTETAVLNHLREREPRSTCIIITHRRSVLEYCERYIEIVEGRVQYKEQDEMR